MMKLLTLFLTLNLTLSFAGQGSAQALGELFDSYSYFIEVEWDQQDQRDLADKKAELINELSALEQSGTTKQEIIEFAISRVDNSQTKSTLSSIISKAQISEMDSSEVESFIINELSLSYEQGANWKGSATMWVGITAAIMIISFAMGKENEGNGGQVTYQNPR